MAWGARGRPPDGRLISPRRLVLVSRGNLRGGDEDEKFEPRRESWGAWTRRRRGRSFVHASRDRSGVMKRVGAPGRRAHRPASRRAGETK